MAQLRQSDFSERWVILSAARGDRPDDFKAPASSSSSSAAAATTSNASKCPFCRHHEHETGEETFVFREGDVQGAPDWSVRVVHNKFPAVTSQPPMPIWSSRSSLHGESIGSHEVVVETPEHGVAFEDLPALHVEQVFLSFRERIRSLKQDARIKYVQVFKNSGREAGASLRHSHSQIVALPVVPQDLISQLTASKEHFDKLGSCLVCDNVVKCSEQLLIDRSSNFISVAPFAPRFPFETWIVPTNHSASFEDTSEAELLDLGQMLHMTLKKLAKQLNNAPYNYFLHTRPFNQEFPGCSDYYHWHICILPRVATLAGFELATGCNINAMAPEKSAEALRNCSL